jgi:hypothetical protein
VHTINLGDVNVGYSVAPWREPDKHPAHLRLSDGALLRDVCAAWGASLRILVMGMATLTVPDIHTALAACPQLAWLELSEVSLPAGAHASLFGAGAPAHPALRALTLPGETPVALLWRRW